MKNIVFLAIAVLFLVNIASAETQIIVNTYEAGYSLSAYSVPETNCKCSFLEDIYLLKNTAEITQAFSITNSEGLPQNLLATTLKPGASTLITITAPLACNAAEFSYDLKVISSLGEIRQLNRNLVAEKCQNLHLALYPINESIEPNSTINYTLTITNIAPFTETYLVSSERLNGFVRDEAYQLTLPAYAQQNLTFTYDFSPNFYGNYTATFKAKAETNKLTSVVSDDITINRNYDFTLQTEEQTICTEIDNEIRFNITNDGKTDNTYFIDIIGNPAYSTQAEVFIPAGEVKEINISPNKDRVGKENVIVKVSTLYGGFDSEIRIPVDVINCYNLDLSVPNRISQCHETEEHEIVLRNNGILAEEVDLAVSGSVELSDDTILIEPNSSQTTTIVIEPQDRIDETIILNITGKDGINRIFQIPTIAATEEECRQPKLLNSVFETTNNENTFKISIQNIGEKQATYELAIDNEAGLSIEEITINAKETEIIEMYVDLSDREFADYAFTLDLETDDKEYEELITVKYQDKAYLSKVITFFNTNWCLWILFGLLLCAFVAFLLWIFLPEKGGSIKLAKIVGIILLIIVIASLITLVSSRGSPEPLYPEIDDDIENLEYNYYIGERIIFDLNEFFIDLDNDTLYFEIISDANYELSEEGIVEFNLEEGVYEANFVAFDLITETRSPPVTISVNAKKGLGLSTFLVKYCAWLSWVALLIFSLFLFAALLKHATSEKEKQEEIKKAERKARREERKKERDAARKRTAKKASKKTRKKKAKKVTKRRA